MTENYMITLLIISFGILGVSLFAKVYFAYKEYQYLKNSLKVAIDTILKKQSEKSSIIPDHIKPHMLFVEICNFVIENLKTIPLPESKVYIDRDFITIKIYTEFIITSDQHAIMLNYCTLKNYDFLSIHNILQIQIRLKK